MMSHLVCIRILRWDILSLLLLSHSGARNSVLHSVSPVLLHLVICFVSESGRDIEKSFEGNADVAARFLCGDRNLLGNVKWN